MVKYLVVLLILCSSIVHAQLEDLWMTATVKGMGKGLNNAQAVTDSLIRATTGNKPYVVIDGQCKTVPFTNYEIVECTVFFKWR